MLFQFIFRKTKNFKKKVISKKTINEWMELSKEERLDLDMKQKDESLRKKKALLKSIREEYIKIKENKT